MPVLIPVLAYAGAAVLTGGTIWATGAFVVASLVVGDYQRRKAAAAARDAYNASLRDRSVVIRSAVSAKSIVYGNCVIGGTLVYGRSWGDNKERLSLVVALQAGHEIDAIEEIYFNDEPLGTLDGSGNVTAGRYAKTRADNFDSANYVSTQTGSQQINIAYAPVGGSVGAYWAYGSGDGGGAQTLTVVNVAGTIVTVDTSPVPAGQQFIVTYNYSTSTPYVTVRKYLGSTSQTADTVLVANSGGEWTTDHRGRGQPYVAIDLLFDEDIFPTGIPAMKFKVRGKKIYDPRTTLTTYSANSALCLRDYMTSSLGFGCASAEIDDALVVSSANICDEQVEWKSGSFQARYSCDGVVSTEANRIENMRMLAQSMAGFSVWTQGKWRMYPGAYRVPSITLTDDDVTDRESISIQSRVARRDLYNAVRGTYVDPGQAWQPVDFPPVTNATYETEDGGERIYLDVQLPLTTDAIRAQRMAKIALEQSRQALTIQAAFSLKAYRVTPGDNVMLTFARYGWSSKVFRVVERTFSIQDGVLLTMVEEASAVYDWNYGLATQVDPAPNTNLPSPWIVNQISGLSVATGDQYFLFLGDGTLIARIFVSWAAIQDASVTTGGQIEIQYREVREDQWRSLAALPGDTRSAYISPVQEGLIYHVRIRAKNALGIASSWTYATPIEITTKAGVPADVSTFSVSQVGPNLRLYSWTMATVPADLNGFEIRYQAGSSFSWGGASFLVSVSAISASVNAWSIELSAPAAGTWSFGIKAIDTSGNYSTNARTHLNVTLATPGAAQPPAGSTFIEIVIALPSTGNFEGRIVYLRADDKLYRWTGTAWTAAVPAVDITGQLTNAQIAAIDAAKLTGQITSTQISDNSISTPKLQAGSVLSANIASGEILAGNIAAGAITSTKIGAGEVQAGNIATNAITSDKIIANAITTGKILVGAVSASVAQLNPAPRSGNFGGATSAYLDYTFASIQSTGDGLGSRLTLTGQLVIHPTTPQNLGSFLAISIWEIEQGVVQGGWSRAWFTWFGIGGNGPVAFYVPIHITASVNPTLGTHTDYGFRVYIDLYDVSGNLSPALGTYSTKFNLAFSENKV